MRSATKWEVRDTPVVAARGTGALPASLRIYWAGSMAAFALMLLIAARQAQAGLARAAWNPLGDPLFGDLLEYIPTFKLLHTSAFWGNPVTSPVAYPPFAAAMFAAIYATGHAIAVYLALAVLGIGFVAWRVAYLLHAQEIPWRAAVLFPITVVLVSFPIEGLIQRGNIELILWMFASAGTYLWLRGREYPAAIFWGLAAAVKLYPIIYLALLIPRRQYRAFVLGASTFLVASLGSMLFLGPTLAQAWRGSVRNVFGYQGIRVAEWSLHELAANHSVFGLVKLIAIFAKVSLAHLTLPYYACATILFAVLFFSRVQYLPAANQLLMVSLFMVMLPPISYFYTLVHLYAPWLLLVFLVQRAVRAGVAVRGLRATLLLFVPVFGAFTLFTFRSVLLFGGLVQAVLLCALFFCSMRYPFRSLGSCGSSEATGDPGKQH